MSAIHNSLIGVHLGLLKSIAQETALALLDSKWFIGPSLLAQ
jgi:hypothetical protein